MRVLRRAGSMRYMERAIYIPREARGPFELMVRRQNVREYEREARWRAESREEQAHVRACSGGRPSDRQKRARTAIGKHLRQSARHLIAARCQAENRASMLRRENGEEPARGGEAVRGVYAATGAQWQWRCAKARVTRVQAVCVAAVCVW